MFPNELDSFEPIAKIIVIGLGGAGNNAVNRMIDEDIKNVDFYVANTDRQALALSKAPNRIVLGEETTGGLGAGGNPETGKAAAEESADRIREIVSGAKMVFIAAGMGGGTGTGAAPVISRICKECGALTVSIVTRPFTFEGRKKIETSIKGLKELREACDSLIVVSNDKLLLNRGNLPIAQAFGAADEVLMRSVKTVIDLILMPSYINCDFADVKNTLQNSGVAFIGFGNGSGSNNATDAADDALACPLIEQSITGARKAICHITCGPKVTLIDYNVCIQRLVAKSGGNIDLKAGMSVNDQLDDQIMLSIIAGDFDKEYDFSIAPEGDFDVDKLTQMKAAQEENKFKTSIEKENLEQINNRNNEESEIKHEEEESLIPDFLKDMF